MRHHVISQRIRGGGWPRSAWVRPGPDARAAVWRMLEITAERGRAALARASKVIMDNQSTIDRARLGPPPTRVGEGIPGGRTSTVQRSPEPPSSDGPRRSWHPVAAVTSAAGRHAC
jgi:hypothetical protein